MTFQYQLPEDRIADWPAGLTGNRADSRLLVGRRLGDSLQIEDRKFSELHSLLLPGDLVILNDTKVLPRRFFVNIADSEVEIVLLGRIRAEEDLWEVLGKPMRKLRHSVKFEFGPDLQGEIVSRPSEDRAILKITGTGETGIEALLDRYGVMPIPPYIRHGRAEERDRELYQTIYAEKPGSIAAPTAGLHFTAELLAKLGENGIQTALITLHVGSASFTPVRDPATHQMTTEHYFVPSATAQAIVQTKAQGCKVVCVGTTTTRALESYARDPERRAEHEFVPTNLFIREGFEFQIADALITNFHHPDSTHLLLVSAFFGAEPLQTLYQHALARSYRFLSYGDAMLLF